MPRIANEGRRLGTATEAILLGLCVPPAVNFGSDRVIRSTAVRQTRSTAGNVGTRAPLRTTTSGGLLKQPDKQESPSINQRLRSVIDLLRPEYAPLVPSAARFCPCGARGRLGVRCAQSSDTSFRLPVAGFRPLMRKRRSMRMLLLIEAMGGEAGDAHAPMLARAGGKERCRHCHSRSPHRLSPLFERASFRRPMRCGRNEALGGIFIVQLRFFSLT